MRYSSSTTAAAATVAIAVILAVSLPTGDAAAQRGRAQVTGDSRMLTRLDTTFAFDSRGSLSLVGASARILVTTWDQDRVRVHATAEDGMRFDATSSRVSLETSSTRRGADAAFEVTVPRGVRVVVRTLNGDITIRGTRGPCEVQTQSGDVVLEDVGAGSGPQVEIISFGGDVAMRGVAGDVNAGSSSGEIVASEVRGAIALHTLSGDLDIRRASSSSVNVRTTSGAVSFDGTIEPSGRYQFVSHSGNIRLAIPRDVSAVLSVATWNGAVDTEFPVTLRPGVQNISAGAAKQYTFEVGGNAAGSNTSMPRITANSFGGNIIITSVPRSGR
jgi:DUF4097 and DUF4098 domain-containing protein YvlB